MRRLGDDKQRVRAHRALWTSGRWCHDGDGRGSGSLGAIGMRGLVFALMLATGLHVVMPGANAQAPEDCKTEKELLTTMMISGARDVVRQSLGIFKCGTVKAEAQRWLDALDKPASSLPGTAPTAPAFPQPQSPPPVQAGPVAPAGAAGNSMASARAVALSPGDTQVVDRIEALDTAKYYRIETRNTAIVTIYLNGPRKGIKLVVLNASGVEIAALSQPDAADVYKIDFARPEGAYFIGVLNQGQQAANIQITINLVSPAPPHSHPDLAFRMSPGGGSFEASFGGDTSYRYAEFEVVRSGLYKVEMRYAGGGQETDIDLRLRRNKGEWEKVADSGNPPGETEVLVEWLEAGRYQVELYRDNGDRAAVSVSVVPTSEALAPTFDGTEVATETDWRVMRTTHDGTDRCYIYTIAKSYSPRDWRGQQPYLLVRIDQGDETVFHSFDQRQFYRDRGAFTAIIRGNVNFQIPVMFEGDQDELKTLELCSHDTSKYCVSNQGLVGLTLGREIEITGTTKDGRTASIVYSLRGYQKAVQAMNRACSNERQTGWLVKRN